MPDNAAAPAPENPQLGSATAAAAPAKPVDFKFTFGQSEAVGGLEGVRFWPRAGARVIDSAVHYAAIFIASLAFGLFVGVAAVATGVSPATIGARINPASPLFILVGILGYVVYHSICEGFHGSSLGKRMLGQVVVTEEGEPCGVGAALGRSLAYFIDSLFFGVVGAMAMKPPLEQRHGDSWCHTVVVKRQALAPAKLRSDARFAVVLVLAMAFDGLLAALAMAIQVVS